MKPGINPGVGGSQRGGPLTDAAGVLSRRALLACLPACLAVSFFSKDSRWFLLKVSRVAGGGDIRSRRNPITATGATRNIAAPNRRRHHHHRAYSSGPAPPPVGDSRKGPCVVGAFLLVARPPPPSSRSSIMGSVFGKLDYRCGGWFHAWNC